jgi:hypothetical protein
MTGLRHAGIVVFSLSLTCVIGCGPGRTTSTPSGSTGSDDEQVEERVVTEKLPDGSVKKTTIRTTRRSVPAAPPPPRPADPYPSDARVRYNVERLNALRSHKGLGPLLYDAKISSFASRGSEQLSHDHTPHAHFAANAKGAPGFGSRAAENQGDPSGVPPLDPDNQHNGQKQIDLMLKLMMDEGPGGGHYDNIMNPAYRRVGIGLYEHEKKLYLTNDFSD